MKAPEKIYLEREKETDRIHHLWGRTPVISSLYEHIEYTRTDAFIEKVCDFFEENIKEEDCKIGSSEWTELRAEYKSLDSFIRAFVGYMKGE